MAAITFVTTNPGKLAEARAYLDAPVEQLDFDYPEPQADDLATVAAHGARVAYREVGGPVIVDDSGLVVDALGGFPGPYSSYIEDTLGVERVSRLARRESDRTAAFRSVVAFCDGNAEPADDHRAGGDEQGGAGGSAASGPDGPPVWLFEGRVEGTIVEPRGEGGFGFDPIFERDGRTFAEMDTDEKNSVSHRGRALEAFAAWHDRER
jgi:XTP/dITP diphosphohydrolase